MDILDNKGVVCRHVLYDEKDTVPSIYPFLRVKRNNRRNIAFLGEERAILIHNSKQLCKGLLASGGEHDVDTHHNRPNTAEQVHFIFFREGSVTLLLLKHALVNAGRSIEFLFFPL